MNSLLNTNGTVNGKPRSTTSMLLPHTKPALILGLLPMNSRKYVTRVLTLSTSKLRLPPALQGGMSGLYAMLTFVPSSTSPTRKHTSPSISTLRISHGLKSSRQTTKLQVKLNGISSTVDGMLLQTLTVQKLYQNKLFRFYPIQTSIHSSLPTTPKCTNLLQPTRGMVPFGCLPSRPRASGSQKSLAHLHAQQPLFNGLLKLILPLLTAESLEITQKSPCRQLTQTVSTLSLLSGNSMRQMQG